MACIPSMFLQTLMTKNASNTLRKSHCLFGPQQTNCNYFVIACTFQVMASLSKYIWYLEFWLREWIFTAKNNEKSLPNLSKILRKSTSGPSLGRSWSHFGASWEASWAHAPKRLDFGGFGEGPGSPRRPIWLQLGGPRPSKIEARTRKNRCQKITCFWHRFLGARTSFWKGFGTIFWRKNTWTL